MTIEHYTINDIDCFVAVVNVVGDVEGDYHIAYYSLYVSFVISDLSVSCFPTRSKSNITSHDITSIISMLSKQTTKQSKTNKMTQQL